MNDQQKIEIANLVGDITALAHMINMTTEMTIFVRYSGHVDSVEIELCRSKQHYNTILTSDGINLNGAERSVARLKKIKLELKKILRTNKIDYSRLNYTERVERDYHLV